MKESLQQADAVSIDWCRSSSILSMSEWCKALAVISCYFPCLLVSEQVIYLQKIIVSGDKEWHKTVFVNGWRSNVYCCLLAFREYLELFSSPCNGAENYVSWQHCAWCDARMALSVSRPSLWATGIFAFSECGSNLHSRHLFKKKHTHNVTCGLLILNTLAVPIFI